MPPSDGLAKVPTGLHLDRAKWAFATRRVTPGAAAGLLIDVENAVVGDLVLCEVLAAGQHKKLQLATGRPSELYVGDCIVAACGARYAPDQFEAEPVLHSDGADLVAGGGIVGRMRVRHARMAAPTRVRPIGRLAGADGAPLNLARFALPPRRLFAKRPSVIAVAGSSMNAGKTTTAASLARGLLGAGYPVGGAKLTGTGACGDVNAFLDAGIVDMVDFTDAGVPSTYGQPVERLERIVETLVAELAQRGCEVAVVEIADGVFQAETAALIRSPRFRRMCDGVVFAAADALGAATGAERISRARLRLLALSGLLSCSPLALAEAERETGIRCLTRDDLLDPATAHALLTAALQPEGASVRRSVPAAGWEDAMPAHLTDAPEAALERTAV